MFFFLKNRQYAFPVWISIVSAFMAAGFIIYKSVYQAPHQLNDIIGVVMLVILLGLAFHSISSWSNVLAGMLITLLFFPPLYWLWRSGQYDTTAIAGLLPVQDMIQYYSDSLRLHYGSRLSIFSTRRPLFAGFFSVILKFTDDNLQQTLVLVTALVVISVIFLAIEIKKTYGGFTAMFVVVIVYFCYKGYGFIGKVMTENLGLSLGLLALAFFLRGMRVARIGSLAIGLFVLTVALNVRAGAFFVIPALVVWGAFHNSESKFSLKQAMIFLSSAAGGFFVNYLVVRGIGNTQGVPFENFGETVYGLVTGYRGWPSFYIDHPGRMARDAWPFILEILRKNPENLLIGIFRAYVDYFKPETMFRFLYFSSKSQTMVSYLLFGFTFLGIYWVFSRSENRKGFYLWMLLGILVSIPFVPPSDDGIRALTVTIPFSALVLALPFSHQLEENITQTDNRRSLHAFTIGLLTLAVAGPLFIRYFPEQPPQISPLACTEGATPLAVWAKEGSYVRLVDNDAIPYSFVPDLRIRDLRESIVKNPFDFFNEISPVIRRVEGGNSILVSLDYYQLTDDSKVIMVIVPSDFVQIGQINRICAHFFVADTYGKILLYLEQSLDPADYVVE